MIEINPKTKFWVAAILQIIVLLAVLLFNQLQFIGGERVLLKLSPPRDPMSLFQGHYLRLDYEISGLAKGDLLGYYDYDFADFKTGEQVYVTLRKGNVYWTAYQVSRGRPKREVAIKGVVLSNYSGRMRVAYGIENYFIPEKHWQEVENTFRQARGDQDIFIEITVSRFGNSLIRKIFIDEEEIDIAKIGEQQGSGAIATPSSATSQAQDSRIISALSQARTVMVYINANDGSYDNFNCQQSDMQSLCKEVLDRQGQVVIIHDQDESSQGACVYSRITTGWYCADSSGVAGRTSVFPGDDGFCVDGVSVSCPPNSN